jgi:hypothetical protein
MAPQHTSTQTDVRPAARITAEVTSWPGVTASHGSRGEWSFKLGKREIGHLHGDHVAHFMLPKDVFDDLFAQDRITHHPVFPDRRGPGARRIEDDQDVEDVIAILREQYDRVVSRS